MNAARALPAKALTIRQPWAWAIIHAGKDVENRDWSDRSPNIHFRGRVCVHAAKGMSRGEYEEARQYMAKRGVICPLPDQLMRSGIIGTVDVIDVFHKSRSRWYQGTSRAVILENPAACEFIPVKGALGYFYWEKAPKSILPMPARWMLR